MAVSPSLYEKLLTADTSGTGTIGSGRASRCKEFVAYVVFGLGTTVGTYKVESAPFAEYTGTWKSLGDLAWSAANTAVSLNFTGIHGALRIRNTVVVLGGSADVYLIGRE